MQFYSRSRSAAAPSRTHRGVGGGLDSATRSPVRARSARSTNEARNADGSFPAARRTSRNASTLAAQTFCEPVSSLFRDACNNVVYDCNVVQWSLTTTPLERRGEHHWKTLWTLAKLPNGLAFRFRRSTGSALVEPWRTPGRRAGGCLRRPRSTRIASTRRLRSGVRLAFGSCRES